MSDYILPVQGHNLGSAELDSMENRVKFADTMTPKKMHEIAMQKKRLDDAEEFARRLDEEKDPHHAKRLALLVVYNMYPFLFDDEFFTFSGHCNDEICPKNCKDNHPVCKHLHTSIYDDTPLTKEFFKTDCFNYYFDKQNKPSERVLNGRSKMVVWLMRDLADAR